MVSFGGGILTGRGNKDEVFFFGAVAIGKRSSSSRSESSFELHRHAPQSCRQIGMIRINEKLEEQEMNCSLPHTLAARVINVLKVELVLQM